MSAPKDKPAAARMAATGLLTVLKNLPSRNQHDVRTHVTLVRGVVKAVRGLLPEEEAGETCARIADALDVHVTEANRRTGLGGRPEVHGIRGMVELSRRLRAGEPIG